MQKEELLKKKPDETELAYICRLGELRDSGIIDMTWNELADVINENCRPDGQGYGESCYRKRYAIAKQVRDEFGVGGDGAATADDLAEMRRELEKEKVKYRDERNAYSKLIREQARKESYTEQFVRIMRETLRDMPVLLEEGVSGGYDVPEDDGGTDLIVPVTDVHAGLVTDNYWNIYNDDVLRRRLSVYLAKILEIQARHGSKRAHVIISELIHGLIHPANRLQSNQDIIEQFVAAVNIISSFLVEMSGRFETVHVYVAPGNHSRINPKKTDDIAHENMDNLIIPFLAARLQNYHGIVCHENKVEQGVVSFVMRGFRVVAVHGDKDTPQNVTARLARMMGCKPYLVLMGHRHYNAMTTCGDTKVVQSGSVCGIDEYAINNRLVGRPEQAVCVMGDAGLVCVYDVGLDG